MAVMHVDMNSYFATVEQQANPRLRGKPLAVSGRPHINSVIAAASIEAKKFGVKSGMGTWEAKKICPQLIFIPGDPAKYLAITGKLLKIFKTYSPTVEIFSIDEVFLELSDNLVPIALEIKRRIREEVGDHITCSIGIAPNKFLAKLASEKKKPDGLTIVTKENLDEILLSSKLDDFCGIGRQTLKRLVGMGIYTVAQLRQIPVDFIGEKLHNMAYGIDDSVVVGEQPEAKSFSHSLTLPKESSDRDYIEAVLLYLSEKVARRMRADNFTGRIVHCNGVQKALLHYIDTGLEIFSVGKKLLPDSPIRALYVGVGNLQKKAATTQSLLPEVQREEKIIAALDLANNRFGENSVFRAATLPVFVRDHDVAGLRTRFRFQ
ncbi:DNA polymerase IV [Candidatus Microgenomates bacterium]|nr:DNA polymerase IV [Candidatus Microgenomates bacterium]